MPRKLYATILERIGYPPDRFCDTEECWIALAQTLSHRAIDMILIGNADRVRLKGLLGLVSIHNQIQATDKRPSLILIGSSKLATTISFDPTLSECFSQQHSLIAKNVGSPQAIREL